MEKFNGFLGWVTFDTRRFDGESVAEIMTDVLGDCVGPVRTTFVGSSDGTVVGFVFHSSDKPQTDCQDYLDYCISEED